MRLVAITRVLDEDDIVEAFARHHAALVDHHIFLDSGSTDRTREILRALRREGLPITLLQVRSVSFAEVEHNTLLFHLAVRQHAADWVLPLDADEFIDARASSAGLRERLAVLPVAIAGLKLRLRNYIDYESDSADDLLVPRRIRFRRPRPLDVSKIFLRAGQLVLDAGNHEASVNDRPVPSQTDDAIVLAHYPRRSAVQEVTKAIRGRLKVLAAGRAEQERGRAGHYTPIFEAMRDAPEKLLRNEWNLRSRRAPGQGHVEDPIRYLGGELRHTCRTDEWMKAMRAVLAYAEALARQHGRLIDENEAIRRQVMQWAMAIGAMDDSSD